MSADAWIKILVHSHGGILLRQENEEILPSVTTQTDLEGIMLSEIGQTQRETVYLAYMWNMKKA